MKKKKETVEFLFISLLFLLCVFYILYTHVEFKDFLFFIMQVYQWKLHSTKEHLQKLILEIIPFHFENSEICLVNIVVEYN